MLRAEKLALVSAAIGAAILVLKFWAYQLTGSLALYSDALESIINVVAAVAAFLALRIAGRPADQDHPYGHHKAEYFSAVIEGALIIVAALVILREAWDAAFTQRALDAPLIGILVNGVATVINAAWAAALLRFAREMGSPALKADGQHVLADVFTSCGVLVGVALVAFTGWLVLDTAVAVLVALNILWSGWGMVRDSVGGLMDKAAPPQMIARIRDLIATHGEGALEAHDVRTRHAGQATFIDFHLVVPGTMTVEDSHGICDRLEGALHRDIPGAVVTIHVEPDHKAKRRGVLVVL